ncbi:monovalent cation/H(+) antiporter subunit G [Allokutzneria multivorans]|uniref:Monovalent cation/H(+) antiporter subunit G n=1 Tax=Allokutzneria multivorans TaxID=1142134 RepID=A0ABP7U0N0_9PSEU
MTNVISSVLLLGGALFCVLGALGMLRLPDVPSRLQAATKPQTLGLLLILSGTALQLPPSYAVGLALVALFQVLTAPVLSQFLGRAAYRTGAIDKSTLLCDDLKAVRDGSRDSGAESGSASPGA